MSFSFYLTLKKIHSHSKCYMAFSEKIFIYDFLISLIFLIVNKLQQIKLYTERNVLESIFYYHLCIDYTTVTFPHLILSVISEIIV